MKKNNPWRIVVGLSVIASISSALFKSNRNAGKSLSTSYTPYIGTWKNDTQSLKVEITDNLEILLNNKKLKATLEEAKPNELVFRDHFGYYLILKKDTSPTLTIYDEAEEQEFYFKRETDK
ncbi:DUF4828 domain-containing protein [Trichococcus sp. K1Tr]|uniref:DUF4828 domain-containing protein n=1 Tax=Trichococcus sp. K1Tr TaxID=3020847 RepID=UPI00232FCFF5|nr:DUF4828 domain-containing protein [Trichococcus sp. K1Tr]MDB6353798.1 DUF4828 domain-containing protein [Trichococcus sp. K1Tr]